MVKITIEAYVDETYLEMETRSTIPTREAIRELLEKQFPCIEQIEVRQERE